MIINDNVDGVSNGVDIVSESFRTKNSTSSEVLASTQVFDADRVQDPDRVGIRKRISGG